ncbi:MAG: hypothetical protein L3K03_04160 [Thermoplasmata archaeon]|nr:hypothetical protein [Thermoplasmata archaeon]
MAEIAQGSGLLSSLALPRSRAILRSPMGRALTVSVAFVYGFISLLVGNMLSFGPTFSSGTVVQVLSQGNAPQWWNYPALVVIAPGGTLILPFFATVTMVIVSIGVGIGMSVGVVLAVRLLRRRTKELGGPTAVSSLAGLTPAMLALVTLGACCSTTAAATAGIGVVAQASGSSSAALLTSSVWYLGVFQMVVLFVALVAQEQLLAVYGILFGVESPSRATPPRPLRFDTRFLVGGMARVALLVAGVTWSLAIVAEWATTSQGSVAAAVGFQAIVEHQLVALLAVAAGLFTLGTARAFQRIGAQGVGLLLRALLLAGGLILLIGVPPPISGWGVHGLGNEVIATLGGTTSEGGVPAGVGGVALLFRWSFQFLLLGGFAVAVALAPERAFRPLLWTTLTDPAGPGDRLDLETPHPTPVPTVTVGRAHALDNTRPSPLPPDSP